MFLLFVLLNQRMLFCLVCSHNRCRNMSISLNNNSMPPPLETGSLYIILFVLEFTV